MEKGANIEAKGKDGKTPLICASQKGHFDVVKYLLKAGAKINDADRDGLPSISSASRANGADMKA